MENDGVHFLATKTTSPRRTRGVLPRPRLSGLAHAIAERSLTVVKAPPGYGKTTLALSWADEFAAVGGLVAWLSIDASDSDVARFAFYLASALGRTGVDVRRLRQALLAPLCAIDAGSLVELLLEGIAEQTKEVFLVLDDFHLLAEPAVFEVLALLCRRAPANLHLVMLGRIEPPSSLMSQVGPENLLEVDGAMLRFDLSETTQLVHRLADAALKPEEIGALQSTTEGWPAAVRAILLAPDKYMKLQATGKGIVSNRPISALMEDVLDHLPSALTEFLLRIAVVDKVCGDLATALSGADNAETLLAQIGHRQLFLSARDQEQRWFSFHPLFREQLLRRLNATRRPEVSELHRRAAQWFAEHALWADAVGHALAAGDHIEAVSWIEACAMQMVQTGDLLTLLSWRAHLHRHLLEMPPRLKLAFAWALGHAMASAEASRLLDEIEAGLKAPATTPTDDMARQCLALRALLKNVDDDGEAASQLARQYLAGGPGDDWTRNVMLNVVASSHLRTGQWQAFHAVPPLLIADDESAASTRFVFNRCYHLCYRGIAEYHQGRLELAASLFQQAIELGHALSERLGIVAAPEQAVRVLPATLLAQVRYQQNRLGEATELTAECLQLARILAPLDFVAAAFHTAVRLAHAEGDIGPALFLLDEADRLGRARGWTRLESMNLLERVRLCLMSGQLHEAKGCLTQLDALVLKSGGSGVRKAYIGRDAFLAHAWVDLAHGTPQRTLTEMSRRFDAAASAPLPLDAARFGATLAFGQLQLGDRVGALASLDRACALAERAGAPRVLLDLPVPVELLSVLRQACRAELAPDSPVARFLADTAAASSGHAALGALSGPEAMAVLSVREKEVLKLVAQGQSNKTIARELGVAPDTIKYHLKGVFSKLGVVNRAQAAVQAKSSGLA